jgi:hypothetical protein
MERRNDVREEVWTEDSGPVVRFQLLSMCSVLEETLHCNMEDVSVQREYGGSG